MIVCTSLDKSSLITLAEKMKAKHPQFTFSVDFFNDKYNLVSHTKIVKSDVKCPHCGVCHDIMLPAGVTKEQFKKDLLSYRTEGKYVQSVLSYLDADQRELLITGYCNKAWDSIFSEED